MTIVHVAFGLMVLAASSATTNSGTQKNLEWKKHYEVAKQRAQAAKRPLVVVIEDPTTEQKLDEESLGDESREILLKEDFELVRVNARTNYGKRVAQAFGAKRLPYTAVTNEMSNRIVFRKAGRMSKTDWTLALAESVKTKGMVSETPVSVKTSQPTSAVVEQVVVEQPYVEQSYSSQPVFSQPTVQAAAPATQVYSQPTTTFKPIISQEMFAPNGLYVMPIGQQCVT